MPWWGWVLVGLLGFWFVASLVIGVVVGRWLGRLVDALTHAFG